MTVKEVMNRVEGIDERTFSNWRNSLSPGHASGMHGLFNDELIWDWAEKDSDIPFLVYALLYNAYEFGSENIICRVLDWHIDRHPGLLGLLEAAAL